MNKELLYKASKMELHYFFSDRSHQMDAFIRNRCETELLAIIKEPGKEKANLNKDYNFIGYDLIEIGGNTSALTNCGGFDETFLPNDLNSYGLVSDYDSAKQIREALPINNPDEPHVNCYLYEVWRHKTIGAKTN